MRRRSKIALGTAWSLAVAIGLLAVDTLCGVQALGRFEVRVTARFVDDTTGQPVEGISVLTLPEAAYAEDTSWVAEERRYRAEGDGAFLDRTAVGTSASDGTIDLRVHVTWCRHIGPISGLFGRQLPPFQGVAALLAEREGYARTVIDSTKGAWVRHERRERGDPYATLDLGEVRLKRAP